MRNYDLDTTCVQGGYTPGNGDPRQIPIYQSTTFKYDTGEDMGKLFDLEASGYFYWTISCFGRHGMILYSGGFCGFLVEKDYLCPLRKSCLGETDGKGFVVFVEE